MSTATWRQSLRCVVGTLRRITLKQLGLAVLIVPLSVFVYRELRRDVVVIAPFSVPPSFTAIGITPEVFANRVGDRLRRIANHVQMNMSDLSVGSDPITIPEVEIPGTTLTLKTFMDVLQTVLGLSHPRIDGDITEPAALTRATVEGSPRTFMITVSLTRDRSRSSVNANIDGASIDDIINRTAELVLQSVDPRLYAVHAMRDHRYDEAMRFVDQTLLNPASSRLDQVYALNVWGSVLIAQRQYDDASRKYEEAIGLDRKSAAAYTNLGIVRRAQHRVDEAELLYEYAVQLDHKDAMAYNDWGVLLKNKSDYRGAIAKYRQAILLYPANAMAYLNLANILLSQKDTPQAVAGFEKAIELDPEYALAYDHLGNAEESLGHHAEAIAAFTKAIATDPYSAAAYSDWGLVLEALGQHTEAIVKYKNAIAVDATYPNAYTNWGDLLKAQGNLIDAEAKYQAAKELPAR